MKITRTILILFAVTSGISLVAQNKTLGVGTATPNPNAALHVESPTGNQGMILPRLTTAQRTAMTLAAADNGMLVYDTDLQGMYIWDGTNWSSAAKPDLPADITLNTADLSGAPEALKITYTGDDQRTLLKLDFANAANPNISNPFVITHAGQGSAMTLTQSGTLGTGGIFQLTNAANPQQAFRALTVGTGNAGRFTVNNAATGGTALVGTTNTDLGGALPPVGVYGEATGTGAAAGSFRITNAGNSYAALFSETPGTGPALFASNIGTANGIGGLFRTTEPTNTYPAIQASTQGAGPGVRVIQDATSVGVGMDVIMQNTGSTATGLNIDQQGLGAGANITLNNPGANNNALTLTTNAAVGSAINATSSSESRAGYFLNNNVATTSPVVTIDNAGAGTTLEAFNNGTGYAIYAQALAATDALYANKPLGSGSGSAGNFNNSEPSNGASTLFAMTNSGVGSALGLINSADGHALAIFNGGVKVSTFQATGGGVISTRATAYTVDSNAYTFPGGFLSEGDTFYIWNTGGGPATIEGMTVNSGQGRIFIVIGGLLRAF